MSQLTDLVEIIRQQMLAKDEALKSAISAAEYVIRLCEANSKAGDSPSPTQKADWIGTVAHCYAAMSFVNEARAALNNTTNENPTKNQEPTSI